MKGIVKMIVLVIIGLLVGTLIGYEISTLTQQAGTTSVTYTIGYVNGMTGAGAEYGLDSKAVEDVAVADFNKMLELGGSPIRFKTIYMDTKGTPEGALASVQDLVETQGVQILTGFEYSSELAGVQAYVNSHHIPIVSSMSASPALAVPDHIFRMLWTVTVEGEMMAGHALQTNITKGIAFVRHDNYGEYFGQGAAAKFAEKGFPFETILFEPDQADYAGEVASLAQKVQQMGADNLAVFTCMEYTKDQVNIIGHMLEHTVLWSVPAYYAETTIEPILPPAQPAGIGEFVVGTTWYNNQMYLPTSNLTRHIYDDFVIARSKTAFNDYDYTQYDAAWVAMMSTIVAGKYDGESIKNVIPTVAAQTIGATGNLALNANGDRASGGMRFAVPVVLQNGTYVMYDSGFYNPSSQQYTLYPPRPLVR